MADDAPSTRSTVLVVDDETGPRASLRMILSPNHRVLEAKSGSEALEVLKREPVDLVTVDLNMPGMGGQELMRTIRAELPDVELIVITGCGSTESATEGIRCGVADYLQKPFDVVQVSVAVARALSRRQARDRLSSFLHDLGQMVGTDRCIDEILEDVQRSQGLRGRLTDYIEGRGGAGGAASARFDFSRSVEFLEVLAETIEAKDRCMRGHARRVALFASLLAERLGLSADEQEQTRIAAFLHDLGKVSVPTDLLLRVGALDPGERHTVERHPEIGARLLLPLDVPPAVPRAIRHHHEWWDGTGYPDGLAGEEIPLIARVIGVADAFDAMSCDLPSRHGLERQQVARELQRYAGIQFDPRLVAEFLAILESDAERVETALLNEALAQLTRTTSAVAAAG